VNHHHAEYNAKHNANAGGEPGTAGGVPGTHGAEPAPKGGEENKDAPKTAPATLFLKNSLQA